MEPYTAALSVLLAMAAAVPVEMAVARFYTRRMVHRDVEAEVKKVLDSMPKMRGGGDPRDLAAARWEKQAERDERAAQLEIWLAEKGHAGTASIIEATMPRLYKLALKLDPAAWDKALAPALAKLKPKDSLPWASQ